MRVYLERSILAQTILALSVGMLGALAGRWIGLPLYQVTGPALLVSAVALIGAPMNVAALVRDIACLLVGISVGSGMNAEARDAMLRWPVAMVAMVAMVVAVILICRTVLQRRFGYGRRAAGLASSPGHMSFVIAMSMSLDGAETTKITMIQTVRVLIMVLAVPLVLTLSGAAGDQPARIQGPAMSWSALVSLVAAGALLGPFLKSLKVPASFLIGGMVVSAAAHLTEWTPGVMRPDLSMAGFVTIGTLIGTRFSGITLEMLRGVAMAAFSTTALAVGVAAAFSLPVAWYLGMPMAHVLVAFAPGGLETMIAMGAIIGADPGFVVACHLGRLLVLPVILSVMLGRGSQFG